MGWQEDLRAQREATERWIRARNAEVARAAHDLEARGRKVYADAVRTARQVVARTPAEVRQLAVAAARGQLGQEVAAMAARKAAPTVKRVIAEVQTPAGRALLIERTKEEARPVVSGAIDEVSFGLADKVMSGGEALLSGGLDGYGDRYVANQNRRVAEDAYDEREHGTARNVGRVAGFAAGLTIGGGPAVARGLMSIVPRGRGLYTALTTAKHAVDPRGLNAMAAGGGALGGVVGQVVDDAANLRLSPLRDYVASGVGGAAGGLATLHGGAVRGGRR